MTCTEWPVTVDPECCPGWDNIPTGRQQQAITLATERLWALSGRRFGLCTACIRPCRTVCLCCDNTPPRPGRFARMSAYGQPYINQAGDWAACGCGCTGCCPAACAVLIEPGPVHDILDVSIDGSTIDPATYHVLNGNILVRSDGDCWPSCQNLGRLSTPGVPGTFSVTYQYGFPPPLGGTVAAAVLACEIGKQCSGQKCRLPSKVTQLSRDGVSLTLDPEAFLSAGLTALPEVNDWLRAVNPYGLPAAGQVIDPGALGQPYQVTWPTGAC